MEVQRSIIDLPLDVLHKVFEMLNHGDKLRLAKSHRLLGEAFASFTRYKYRRVHLSHVWPWSDIVTICGANIVDLDHDYALDDNELKVIETHCPNLRVVHLCIKDDNCAGIKSLIGNLNLNHLTTVRLWIGGYTSPYMWQTLQELPRLSRLSFNQFTKEYLPQIYKLVDLEELKIRPKRHGTSLDLFEICSHMKKLRYLKVTCIDLGIPMSPSSPEVVGSNIEELELSECVIQPNWPLNPRLKDLKIHNRYYHSGASRQCKWIAKHSLALENLKMIDTHPEPNDFLDMLRGCKMLRSLIIKLPDLQITKEFLASITGILKANGVTPDKPLQLKLKAHKKVKNVRLKDLLAETPNAELMRFW